MSCHDKRDSAIRVPSTFEVHWWGKADSWDSLRSCWLLDGRCVTGRQISGNDFSELKKRTSGHAERHEW